MVRDVSDYDDIETDASREPSESPRLCAMVSIDGVVTTKPLPDHGDITIGRDSSCDIVIPHVSVSRRHARLRMAPLEIMDLGSRNGTRVRGAALAANTPTSLSVGEAIQIGEAAILIHAVALVEPLVADPLDEDDGPEASGESFARLLEMECARSARSRSPFALVRLEVRDARGTDVAELLRTSLRVSDALGVDGPGSYQVILPDTASEQAVLAVGRTSQQLARHGIQTKLGIARYPNDGVTAEQLAAHAWEQLARTGTELTAMDTVRATIAQIAGGDVSVLITGETGVGKELCAEMIHRLSARAAKPFVKLNCSAIVETLIESELFGHERGAFTGATSAQPGLLEAGNGGTVFLDEIGELPIGVQSKLLRVLEERVVRRVGASSGKTLDVRFICATNRELLDEVDAGRFRRDLYYRINGVTLAIPPLRQRRTEIAPLARAFAARSRSGSPLVLGVEVIGALERHDWPGNIRELRNTIERAVLLSSGGSMRASHLAIEPQRSRTETATVPFERVSSSDLTMPPVRESQSLANAVADLEKTRILQTLNECGGNQTRAARVLGISRNTLLSRLDAYGITRPRKP